MSNPINKMNIQLNNIFIFNCDLTAIESATKLADLNRSVCLQFKNMIYPIIIIESIFIKRDVLKKLLNGLITNNIINIIDVAVHIQIFFVSFVKIDKLNG